MLSCTYHRLEGMFKMYSLCAFVPITQQLVRIFSISQADLKDIWTNTLLVQERTSSPLFRFLGDSLQGNPKV